MNEVMYLQNLTTIRNNFVKTKIKIERSNDEVAIDKMKAEQEVLIDQFAQEKAKYFEKFPAKMIGDEGEIEKQMKSEDPDVRYAYIVFRSMDALNLAIGAYNLGSCGSCKKCCILSCFGDCCCSQAKKRLRKKHIFGKWPGINVAGLPDNIKWENLGYTAKERRVRAAFSWLIALILIAISIVGIVVFKE